MDFDLKLDFDLDFDFVFDFDFEFYFALHNTPQTLDTMAIVTLPERRRTSLPLSFMLPPYRTQEARDICHRFLGPVVVVGDILLDVGDITNCQRYAS